MHEHDERGLFYGFGVIILFVFGEVEIEFTADGVAGFALEVVEIAVSFYCDGVIVNIFFREMRNIFGERVEVLFSTGHKEVHDVCG